MSNRPASWARDLGLVLRPEEEAVLLCIQAERTPAQQERLQWLVVEGGLDWGRLWKHAVQQHVQPVVAETLITSLASSVPEEVVQEAKTIRLQTFFSNLAAQAELERIGGAFHARGVPCAPLKGTHLAQRLYGSLAARQAGDIDVLVPEAQLETGRSCLKDLGYEPAAGVSAGVEGHSFHGVPYVQRSGATRFVVELHWGLSDPRFVTVDYRQLWARILAGSAGEERLRPLPTEETLVFLALHLPKHDIGILRLLADVDRLIRVEGARLDWPYTLALAGRWSMRTALYFTLQRARQFFGTEVPAGVLDELQPAPWRRALVGALVGPGPILRPPSPDHLRNNQFRLAYCAMLTPFSRCLDAYDTYLFSRSLSAQARALWRPVGVARRLAHGFGWTGIILARSLTQGWRATPGGHSTVG